MNVEKYINGFNSGYILAIHKPELLQTVAENLLPTDDYIVGMLEGRTRLDIEKLQAELNNIRRDSNSKEGELEKF